MNFKLTSSVGFIGCGNMAQAIIKGLIDSSVMAPSKIYVSNRSQGKLQKVKDNFGINIVSSNEELIEKSQVVILAMKPQDLLAAIDPLISVFIEKQIVMSLSAGITLSNLKNIFLNVEL